jgi:dihydropteroate synthase
MGILNLTPDSFYSGSRYEEEKNLVENAGRMLEEGANILDLGGYSTRPGAPSVEEAEELQRVVNGIKFVAKNYPQALISVDTFRTEVARAALDAGACMVNDVSGGSLDEKMFNIISAYDVPYVLMHMRGNPETMKTLVHYDDLFNELVDYFHRKIELIKSFGVKDLILDPGFGFAKNISQNFSLLNSFHLFKIFKLPLLAGLSRKSMVYRSLILDVDEALNGTTVLHTLALQNGANILRVHDVKEAVEVVKLVHLVKN